VLLDLRVVRVPFQGSDSGATDWTTTGLVHGRECLHSTATTKQALGLAFEVGSTDRVLRTQDCASYWNRREKR